MEKGLNQITKIIFFILGLFFFADCHPKEKCNCELKPKVQKFNDSVVNSRLPLFKKHLSRFDEQLLSEKGEFSIRFSLWGSWGHIKFYTLQEKEDSFLLQTKLFKESEGVTGKYLLMESHSKILSERQIKPILKMITDSC